jgi:hypothetical protein
VSAVTTPRRVEETRPQRPARTFADRLLAAVPLASIYLWLCIVYGFEAWRHVTPWLFTDELETTQISRSIAATGHAARRGAPYPLHSLYPLMLAPVWLIHDVATAYSGVKYLDVFVMTSVIFPTYFLARLVVRRGWALFAAVGAAVIPSLAYSSWIVEETLAYPYVALCFLLITMALIEKSRGWIIGAIVASLVAPFVRSELIVIPIVVVFALFFAAWTSAWANSRRASWSWGDYIGFVVLVAGLIITVSGIASHHSQSWYSVTTYWKHRIFILGDWAAGSLAIGLGVIPLVFGLAALVPARGEKRRREVRMFRCVSAAGIIGFGLYTGMKAAYLSTVFATRVEERNLIYIAPLLFIGSALVLERRRANLVALAAAAAYGLYLVVGTPFQMGVQLYSDALGFSILQQANRYYEWTPVTAQWLLIAILVVGVALLVAATLLPRSGVMVTGIAAALAVGILAWNATGEISAASGTVSISRQLAATLRHPFTWVDHVAQGKPTLYLAQGVADPDPEWELEFWNRSVVTVDSLDATLAGPGPSGTPNITADGRVYWSINPNAPGRVYDYAVEDWPCVDFAGPVAAVHFYNGGASTLKEWKLIKLTKPNRLRAECSGIYADGWSGPNDSTYFRFVAPKPGWLRIRIARENWPSTPVHVQLASITTKYREPALGRVFYDEVKVAKRLQTKVIWVRTPDTRFGARVVVVDKFIPREVDPRLTDPRTLGAHVDYRFFTKLPHGAKPRTGG